MLQSHTLVTARRSPSPSATQDDQPGRIRVSSRDREADSRIFAYLLVSFLSRAEQLRRRHFEDDIDLAVIAEAVAMAAIDPQMRDPTFVREFRSVDKVVGTERQRGVNALSIAAATGIPRETARRKIKRLLALGVLSETGRGKYVLKPGYLQSPAVKTLFEELTRASIRFVNECLDQRVLQIAASSPDPRD